MDAIKNLAKVDVSTGYDASAVTVVVASGHGAKLPDPAVDGAFNLTWWDSTNYPDPSDDPNVEITRCTARSTDTLTVTRAQEGTSASTKNTGGATYKMILSVTKKTIDDLQSNDNNLLKNGNFINNSTNGYGSTADDWTGSNANPVQGGFPSMTKQQLIDLLGVSDGDIEGLWNLNEASGNAVDLSSNGYTLTETGGTIANSSDGLMSGGARDFESGDTELFTIADASCANLEIAGSQTWFAWAKPEALPGGSTDHLTLARKGTTTAKILRLSATGQGLFFMTGLSASISADVIAEAGKWCFVCGVYDATGNTLAIYVNGVKKSVAVTGSPTDTNGNFAIGAHPDGTAELMDGLIQNAGVLSVALTDAQVKRLWAFTSYKGTKIRRATNNAILSQALNEDLVERLRGKTITVRAEMYQAVASTGTISIDDGTATASTTTTTTGSWVTVSATKTISATATAITIKLNHSDSDGNTWFKEVALYQGSSLLPYSHSADDWSRFPRSLKMDIPKMYGAKPYQYEENRVFSYTPTAVYSGGTTDPNPNIYGSWSYHGSQAYINTWFFDADAETGNRTSYALSLPITMSITGATRPVFIGHNMNGSTFTMIRAVGVTSGDTSLTVVCSMSSGSTWESYVSGQFDIV